MRCSVGMKLRENWGVRGFTGDSDGEKSACNAGEPGSIPEFDLFCFVIFLSPLNRQNTAIMVQ